MARSNLLWVRDAMTTTTDVGDTETYGGYAIDLLWKARAGESIGANPAAIADGATSDLAYTGSPEPRALAGALPDQDVQGALIKRVILTGVSSAGTSFPSMPGERTTALRVGLYHGLVVQPMTNGVGVIRPPEADEGHQPLPGHEVFSVAVDWLYWDRIYATDQGQRAFNYGILPVYEPAWSWHIDTRNTRSIDEWGKTLIYVLSASPGQTLNGFCLKWSVLLQLPS